MMPKYSFWTEPETLANVGDRHIARHTPGEGESVCLSLVHKLGHDGAFG